MSWRSRPTKSEDRCRAVTWTRPPGGRVQVTARQRSSLFVGLDRQLIWHLFTSADAGITAFGGRVTARHVSLGWYEDTEKDGKKGPAYFGARAVPGTGKLDVADELLL